MGGSSRNTAKRDQDRAAIRRLQPPCSPEDGCGKPIDYDLEWPHPMSFVVDHKIPISSARNAEERAALDSISNKQAMHNKCNRAKWHSTPEIVRSFVTSRTW